MWIKYPSFLMLVRVQTGSVRLIIPLPLFVLDQTLAAFEDLCLLADRIIPGLSGRWVIRNQPYFKNELGLRVLIKLCRDLLLELRKYGTWRMVEVEIPADGPRAKKVRVYIDFI